MELINKVDLVMIPGGLGDDPCARKVPRSTMKLMAASSICVNRQSTGSFHACAN